MTRFRCVVTDAEQRRERDALEQLPAMKVVRGRFVMRDGALVTEAKGHGLNVRRIQQMPTPTPRNTHTTTKAILEKRGKRE